MEACTLVGRSTAESGARRQASRASGGCEIALLCGRSQAIRALRSRVERLAAAGCNVLLTGETGVGKGLAARALHAASRQPDAPFVHVDCSAFSPGLVESELFGHERGAFTGAVSRRSGRFERASGGTLFLDEIGELAPALQAKLLHVLEEREYERVGGQRALPLRARVVAATNLDLSRALARGRFRADLYYRLAVVELRLPPLRERIEDIPLLVEEACRRLAQRRRTALLTPPARMLREFANHDWPGNVRELMNAVERWQLLGPQAEGAWRNEESGAIQRALASRVASVPGSVQGAALRAMVGECGGNVAEAARRLGMARSTLRRRLARIAASPVLGSAPVDSREAAQLEFGFEAGS